MGSYLADPMQYYYEEDTGSFVVENYNKTKTFSSFLPGIAGKNGIPLWVFYVNRGQCISSFGIGDKNNAILEFFPANNAYKMTPINGFRTFCKIIGNDTPSVYEIFAIGQKEAKQMLKIKPGGFSIEEVTSYGLSFTVTYFTVPNEGYAALVRKLTVKNLTSKPIKLELLDGIAQILPFGVHFDTSKFMSYTSRAWMKVKNLDNDIAFFKLSMSTGDSPEVSEINSGNFCLSFLAQNTKETILKPVVDPTIIFGNDSSLQQPTMFIKNSLSNLYKQTQITEGRIPCNFVGAMINLDASHQSSIYTVIGQVKDISWINAQKDKLTQVKYLEAKETESHQIIKTIMSDIETKTSHKLFDLYCKQTYLDNILRGGYPMVFAGENQSKVVHIYIRKHGDQERDYNWFYLEPSYYSQGNGNFRDINQNRRCDVSFHPQVGDFDIKTFMNLIQTDGFNPLVLTGTTFTVQEKNSSHILSQAGDDVELGSFLKNPFTIGQLIEFLARNNIELKKPTDEFIALVLFYAEQSVNAVHGEGYWIDHWTYNLDLIENYLSIYPEKEFNLFFEDQNYKFYDTFIGVKPRRDKYVIINEKIRQYNHLFHDNKKEMLINQRQSEPNFVRMENGNGEIYKTSLFVKILSLVLNKFATLDPYGMGVEMESNKPGWSDAMNGLPGIFGSSMPETYELYRYCEYLLTLLEKYRVKTSKISLPIEIYNFLTLTDQNLEKFYRSSEGDKHHLYWDKIAQIREDYRKRVFHGLIGEEKNLSIEKVEQILNRFLKKIRQGIEKALEMNDGIYPTYFYFDAEKFSVIKDNDGNSKITEEGLPNVSIGSFKPYILPIFLEGFVRALKIQNNKENAREIWQKVRNSKLYDQKLKMYKLNAPLEDQPDEIGRAKGFTSGWLENGSIWMHMEYKYLLELLTNNLYEEFFIDMKNVLIPFQDPLRYGRPTTENSSFICSSAYPDEKLHGNGFYARLSGSTAEFLNIWNIMMVGKQPFFVNKKKELCLQFKPVLAEWLFTKENSVEFMFLGSCNVTYYNPKRKNTYENCKIQNITVWMADGSSLAIEGEIIREPHSHQIRNGEIKKIEVYLL